MEFGAPPSVFSRGGSLLPSIYADGRSSDDVIGVDKVLPCGALDLGRRMVRISTYLKVLNCQHRGVLADIIFNKYAKVTKPRCCYHL